MAAVDFDDLPGDPAGIRGGQEGSQGSNIIGFAETFHCVQPGNRPGAVIIDR
jgi:hypothetical protein